MSTIIKHEGAAAEVFAPILEVLRADLVNASLALCASADALTITDAASFAKANDLTTCLHSKEKEIEARRAYLKRPLIDVGRAIEEIVGKPAAALSSARKSLIGKIAAWDRRQKEIAEAAARKAQEEAEAERRRLQAIADAEHAAKVAEAKAKAEAEAKELEAITGTPVVAEPVKIAPAPVVRVAPVAVVAPVSASAVTSRMVPKLVISDPRKVAALYQCGMEVLVKLDEAAIKRALESGAIIDGARMEMVEQFAQKAVR